MLEKLKNLAIRKGYHLARKKGVACPDCGQRLRLPPIMPEGGLKARFGCRHCDWRGSLLDTFEMGRNQETPLKEKPVGSRIEKKGSCWLIPGTGKVNGEWFFGTIWMGFVLLMMGAFLFQASGEFHWFPMMVGLLFMMPFVAVGLWVLYLASRMTFGKTEVRIDGSGVKVTKRLYVFLREDRIATSKLEGVRLEFDRDRDSGPSAELLIERADGKPVKINAEISIDEKRWLLGQWLEALGLETKVEEVRSKRFKGGEFQRRPIQSKGVELEPKENGVFFLTVRNRVAPWLMAGGAFPMVIGSFLLVGSSFGDDGDEGILRIFRVFFGAVGLVFSLIPVLLGMGAFLWGLRTFGEVRKYVFYPDRVEFATVKRGGRIAKSGSWPKSSVTDVVVSRSGESNGETRYRVQIRAAENVNLVQFAPGETAGELEGWIRDWMEEGENS